MERLRREFEFLGFAGVEIYCERQCCLRGTKNGSAAKIEHHLREALGYEVTTFIRSTGELRQIAGHRPFPSSETDLGHFILVAFLSSPPDCAAAKNLIAYRGETDDFHIQIGRFTGYAEQDSATRRSPAHGWKKSWEGARQCATDHDQGTGRKVSLKPTTLTPEQHLAASDPKFAALIAKSRPYAVQPGKLVRPFDALAESIAYQQLSGKAAATIFGRVRALYPRRKWLSPELIIATPDERLRGAGLSRSKTAALKDLAAKTLDGTVPTRAALDRMSDDEIIARLTMVRGIGRWTVEMLLLFDLGRLDVWPVDDYGVRKGYAKTFRKKELPKPKKLQAIGEKWRPYRSVAAWYFWRALDVPAEPT